MKRSAAISGPTPAFLRWTVEVPCPFRDPHSKNATDAAFRDLRSLRAIAVGELDGRIVENVCLHPDAFSESVARATGFPVDEVYAAYGGKDHADSLCRNCPANIPVSADELASEPTLSKAGCFGWLPFGQNADSSQGFMRLMDCGATGDDLPRIVDRFEVAARSTAGFSDLFSDTSPAWYGVWSSGSFTNHQLRCLIQICDAVQCESISWKRLARAIHISCDHQLSLCVDLLPIGHSDGIWWATAASCTNCGVSDPASPCSVCGSNSAPKQSQRKRVLGMRPYLKMISVFGEYETKRLLSLAGR